MNTKARDSIEGEDVTYQPDATTISDFASARDIPRFGDIPGPHNPAPPQHLEEDDDNRNRLHSPPNEPFLPGPPAYTPPPKYQPQQEANFDVNYWLNQLNQYINSPDPNVLDPFIGDRHGAFINEIIGAQHGAFIKEIPDPINEPAPPADGGPKSTTTKSLLT
jgi:hypothetical protein